jgi:hypothetical protein
VLLLHVDVGLQNVLYEVVEDPALQVPLEKVQDVVETFQQVGQEPPRQELGPGMGTPALVQSVFGTAVHPVGDGPAAQPMPTQRHS